MGGGERVTVVIVTRDREDELHRTLSRLTALPERPPVIVIDNRSKDGATREARARFPGVRVVPLPANYGAAGRTVGARLAGTPYVAFCDDDSWWEPGALVEVADRLDGDPGIGLVAGHVLVGPAGADDPTSVLMAAGALDEHLQPSPLGPRGVTGFLACAAVVRRTAFLAAGGFEANFGIGGEEELVSLDLAEGGWKLVYAPSAIAHHYPSVHRSSGHRRRLLLRNSLLTALLRYSPATVCRRGVQALRSAGRRPALWPALVSVVAAVPWALANRRAVSSRIEAAFVDRLPLRAGETGRAAETARAAEQEAVRVRTTWSGRRGGSQASGDVAAGRGVELALFQQAEAGLDGRTHRPPVPQDPRGSP